MTQPVAEEQTKRGPGRPRKEDSKDADAPEGVRFRTVHMVTTCQGDGLDPWVSNVDWATVLPTNHACGSFDWIVLVGGHTVVAKKAGRKIHIPWSACKNGVELTDPLTEDEIKRGAR